MDDSLSTESMKNPQEAVLYRRYCYVYRLVSACTRYAPDSATAPKTVKTILPVGLSSCSKNETKSMPRAGAAPGVLF